MNPAQALRAKAQPGLANVIIESGTMPAGTVAAVDVARLAMGSRVPNFRSSRHAAIHMDTAPQPLGTPGALNVVAAPTRSMFQTDSIALRAVTPATWSLRRSGAVAVAEDVAW